MARGQVSFQQYGGVLNGYYGYQANDPGRYGPYEGDPMRYDAPPRDRYQEHDGRSMAGESGAYEGSFHRPNDARENDYRYSGEYRDPRGPRFSPGYRNV